LNRTELVRQIFPVEIMCPAAGQGALAIEARSGDRELISALAFLDDAATRAETNCERALLQAMGGGCQVPIGANARWERVNLQVQAVIASPAGKLMLRESVSGVDAFKVGETAATNLLSRGGNAILEEVYGHGAAMPQQP